MTEKTSDQTKDRLDHTQDRLDHTQDRLDHTQALLEKITQIVGPQTPTGKALIGARNAFNSGDLKLTQQRLYNAFDTLKPSDSSVSLPNEDEAMTTTEKNVIEKTIAWLLQKPQTTSVTKQEIIDNLLNQSYQTLRQTGSRASWRYLLEALDKAGIPLDQTSPQLQKTLMNITQKLIPANFIGLSGSSGQSGQVGQVGGKRTYKARGTQNGKVLGMQNGGDPNSVGGVALASGIGLGSLVLLLIIYFIYRSRGASPMSESSTSISSQTQNVSQISPEIQKINTRPPLMYGKLPPEKGTWNWVEKLDRDIAKLFDGPEFTPQKLTRVEAEKYLHDNNKKFVIRWTDDLKNSTDSSWFVVTYRNGEDILNSEIYSNGTIVTFGTEDAYGGGSLYHGNLGGLFKLHPYFKDLIPQPVKVPMQVPPVQAPILQKSYIGNLPPPPAIIYDTLPSQ